MRNKFLLILILHATLPIFAMEKAATPLKLTYANNQKDEFLFRAVIVKDLYSVNQALAQGAHLEARCTAPLDEGKTPLAMACYFGTPLIAQHLMSAGANCNACDDSGLPPLYHALQGIYTPQCVPFVEALVSNGAHIGIEKRQLGNTITPEGSTPIHRIAEIMQNTRFGDRDNNTSFDIKTAPEVFKRLKLIITIIVKETIHQAYRKNNPSSWETTLQEIFAKKDARGKAAYELFERHESFAIQLKRSTKPIDSRDPLWSENDRLEYELFKLLHPKLVGQYAIEPNLKAMVRQERSQLE